MSRQRTKMRHPAARAAMPAAGVLGGLLPFDLPEIAGIPGLTWVVSAVFAVATWWLVYLLFSAGGREEEEEDAPASAESAATPPAHPPIAGLATESSAVVAVEPAAGCEETPTSGSREAPTSGAATETILPSTMRIAAEESGAAPMATAAGTAHWDEDLDPTPDLAAVTSGTEEIDAYARDLAALEQVDRRLVSCATIDAALETALAAMRDAMGAPAAAVWTDGSALPTEDADTIGEFSTHASRQAGLAPAGAPEPELKVLFAPWLGALEAGEAACIPDCSAEPDLRNKLPERIGALALAPFPSETGACGGIVVAWPQPLDIGERQIAMVRRLGAAVGLALERARLREELAVRQTQARVLVETGGALARARDLRGTLEALLHLLHEYLGYPACAVMLMDEERRELYVASMAGYEEGVGELRVPLDGNSVTATAAREQRAVNVPDVSAWPGYIPGSQAIRSELALPLMAEGKTLGVLDVESEHLAGFDRRDRVTLQTVASEAALVLAHSRLVAAAEERAARLQMVDEMARAISTTLDVHSLFQIVVDRVRVTLGCDRATLLIFDHDSDEAKLAANSSAIPIADLDVGIALPIEELVEGELGGDGTVYVPELTGSGRVSAKLYAAGYRSMIRVPIEIDGKVAGLFAAASLRPRAFSHAQLVTLESVAPHVSAALRNARLYEQLESSYQRLNEAQVQLVQAEQLRVLGEMASGVAHNFNNVLGAILGRAQLVRARLEDPRLAHELSIIEQAATDGAATVRRLQEFTRVRTDREFVPVDLSQIARDALALTRPWWKDRPEAEGITYGIVTDLAEGAWVEGQAHELREVVMNVLLNAIEAMPNGGSLVLRGRAAGGSLTLEISDSGVGMSEEVRSRIFHPFYSTKGPHGTGLGLSIAYGIVQRHDGQLEVESRLGAGTTVRITLPATHRAELPAASGPSMIAAPFQARLLVVEDEPAIASLLQDLLTNAGYQVGVAHTGREAVEHLLESDFHLVLTDLGMPEMSGWELARHCRDLYPELPVVLVTGWGVELDENLVVETGVRGVVSKPFSVSQVLEIIARSLESGSGSSAQAA